jgi:hypothetical protein
LNIANGGVLSFRDEGPSKGDMLGPAEAVLFGKRDGSGAILI